ncbi:hypothetical protein NDU88_008193 [Pleurodeles waltl]|uniref:Lamina-associated polypeptide 2 alpha C-terminal domain-containing protein n=1 Tax=Pleurodeles waltl TaxID=8319 RepID=A0AAV7PTN2_PLEWA|nr:hypothetical protein NDU88_008193 [Pleurodeles waltl]
MGFQEDEAPESSSRTLLHQFQSSTPIDVPVHFCLCEVQHRELQDPDKVVLPWFMAKLYQTDFPDSIQVDSFVASLVGHTSLAKERWFSRIPRQKGGWFSLEGVLWCSSSPLDGIYGVYVARSIMSDLKTLYGALDECSDCSGVLDMIELQVVFLSDVSFDVVRAHALAKGACVAARRNLVLRDWRTEVAWRSSALRLPFPGSVLFGADLETRLHKLLKKKKHSSSLNSYGGARPFFRRGFSSRQPMERQFVRAHGWFPAHRGREQQPSAPPSKQCS